jgi:hypothetical protein
MIEAASMQPYDKMGRKIYPNCYDVLLRIGETLTRLGWRESKKSANLFYKELAGCIVFADMRGTEIVPIWEDPRPMIYVSNDEKEQWKRRRSNIITKKELDKAEVPYRHSFYDLCEEGGLEYGDINWDYKYPDVFAKGFCNLKSCDKMLDDGDLFCSKECELAYDQLQERELRIEEAKGINRLPRCAICKIKLKVNGPARLIEDPARGEMIVSPLYRPENLEVDSGTLIEHHISYEPEKKILVCPACHNKIHHSNDPAYTQYRPKDSRKRL